MREMFVDALNIEMEYITSSNINDIKTKASNGGVYQLHAESLIRPAELGSVMVCWPPASSMRARETMRKIVALMDICRVVMTMTLLMQEVDLPLATISVCLCVWVCGNKCATAGECRSVCGCEKREMN